MKKVEFHIRIAKEIRDILNDEAHKKEISINQLIVKVIDNYVKNKLRKSVDKSGPIGP